ncbi:hypothetical protein [Burkholderia cepacia]|uniref:Uncharacterized protein n=1 Tax=Burkholderia cepacia TaxID=292 RepID=A0AAX2RKE4_BURCE|nr:hypothetical protein [Burkholderia cepacia]TES99576.1 hypothetical protein E3D36_24090 [Burkholderia cepacia]TEU41569.1 hypothetical protein E3D37_26475 [Burkholderia cepacia]TEU48805.1 hypothetical protein E3D38_21665 [Burkholderia cepacia]TEU95310.1 hypothetical protein E3D40_24565 [Burkholderia cepacia]TEV04704.1 hypothetical protein E3D44_26090 [Burkholderia cepacia]
MKKLDEALELLGIERARQPHQQHVLLMAIQSFAMLVCDEELERACEEKMAQIRAAIAANDQ